MYFYEHTNGTIHQKPDYVVDTIGVDEYFNSPFVRDWWWVSNEELDEYDATVQWEN